MQTAYRDQRDGQHLGRIFHGQVPPLESARPGLPRPIYQAVRRATDATPDARFQSAADFGQALEAILGGLGPQPSPQLLRRFYLECFGTERDRAREKRLSHLLALPEAEGADFAWQAPELAVEAEIALHSDELRVESESPRGKEPDTEPQSQPFSAPLPRTGVKSGRAGYLRLAVVGGAVLAALLLGLLLGHAGANYSP
jgi:hypothetical protein